jgi:hypothetical protein
MDEPYLVQHNFKVSIRLQDNTKAMKQINSDVFVGVSPRKRSAIFYLSWINNKSTRSGILQFLELKDDNKFFSCTSVCKVEYTGGVW